MIVLDASVLLELALGTPRGQRIAGMIQDPTIGLHAPHLVDIEVMQVLRRLERSGEINNATAKQAIRGVLELDIERHAHVDLLDRVWQLRKNATAYDAVYLALAEALDATLLTCDKRLARSPHAKRRIEIV
jgi:predicted nucleic acid-binding protein